MKELCHLGSHWKVRDKPNNSGVRALNEDVPDGVSVISLVSNIIEYD